MWLCEKVSHPWIPLTFQNCLHYIHCCGRCFNKIHKMLLKTSEQKLGWALKLRKPSWFMWCRCMLVRLRSKDRLSPVPVKISEVTEESRKNQKTRSWFLFKYTCFGLWTFFWFVYISPTFNKNYLFFYSFKSWIMTLIPNCMKAGTFLWVFL